MIDQILAWARKYLLAWSYIYGGSRTDPATTRGTDCSGFTHAAFWTNMGISIGWATGSQYASPMMDTIYEGNGNWNNVPWGKLQPCDVILMSRDTMNYSSGTGSHVGLYAGAPGKIIDCGSTPCPTERDITWYGAIAICVRRVKGLSDDMSWNEDINGVMARDRLIGIDIAANETVKLAGDVLKVTRENRTLLNAIIKIARENRELTVKLLVADGMNEKDARKEAEKKAAELDKFWRDDLGASLKDHLSESSYDRK